jgi:hypothetical protein
LFGYRWRQNDFVTIFIDDHVRQFIFITKVFIAIAKVIILKAFDFNGIFIVFIDRRHKLFQLCSFTAVIYNNAEIIALKHLFCFEFLCQIVIAEFIFDRTGRRDFSSSGLAFAGFFLLMPCRFSFFVQFTNFFSRQRSVSPGGYIAQSQSANCHTLKLNHFVTEFRQDTSNLAVFTFA